MDKVKKIASQDGANDERLAVHAQNYGFRQTSLAFAMNVEEDEYGKEKAKTRPEIPKEPDLSPAMQALLEEAYTLFSCDLHFPLTLCTCPVCISEENLELCKPFLSGN